MAKHKPHDMHLSSWQAIKYILNLWSDQAPRLIFGVFLALAALCCWLVLVQFSGLRLAGVVTGSIVVSTALLRMSGIGRILFRYAERLFAHDAMFRVLAQLRVWFFRSLADGAAAGLGFKRAGDMLSRLVSDIGTLDGLYLQIILPFFCACLTFSALILIICKQNFLLGSLISLLFFVAAFLIPYSVAKLGQKGAQKQASNLAALRVKVLDLTGGLREIRTFNAEQRIMADIKETDAVYLNGQFSLIRQASLASMSVFFCGQSAIFLILLALSGLVFFHIQPLPGVVCLFLTVAAFESISALTRAGLQAGAMGASAQRVVEIAVARPVQRPALPLVPAPVNPSVYINNLKFRWAEDRPYIFNKLNLTLSAGSYTVLLGPSGIGKSSLAALLLKAATPESGTLSLDDIPFSAIDTDSLRRQIAWLSQATHIFDDTIRANLLLGRPEATEDELWTALEEASVADVVHSLPEGLDTWLGEGGMKLSGGQGRRIALARTLLTKAPILILDEPTTGLDAQTEQSFLMTLNTLAANHTILLVTHRLTGVETPDQIWRLSKGQAVQEKN
ncbi:ABC transporter ATP-binding protein [Acetobacter sp. DmW_043]|uniref:thiol reductant ABC exporter subunit CydC n=1 Tax=Acetobacter sp. DmW_043 TaxID=1670658 RepID=UPI000A375F2C|nr:thiol reductant ABC exporter subunit CydC [Acetobacter sp. DmW_043]OUI85599.1 ABC transporter ATP-binding protein [Acetobacter sp. DmW_043]